MRDTMCAHHDSGPFEEHPWVLVTGTDDARTRGLVDRWTSSGHEVFLCAGPTDGHSCPLVRGEPCPIADSARSVVNALDVSLAPVQDLMTALADRYPDLPVIHPGS